MKRAWILLFAGCAVFAQKQSTPVSSSYPLPANQLNGASFTQVGSGSPSGVTTCLVAGLDKYFDTAGLKWYSCTVAGAPGTWIESLTGNSNLAWGKVTGAPAFFTNPMTTAGDLIYGGASGVATRLAFPGNGTFCLSWSAGVPSLITCPGAGEGLTSVGLTMPTWLAVGNSPLIVNGTIAVTPATGQTPHQVIGTCGAATAFGPCTLQSNDLPTTLQNGTVGTTQSPADNSTKVATTAYVDTGLGGKQPTGPYATCTGDLAGTNPSCTVHGIAGVPLCAGFTPTNGQVLQYTTGSSPNPCYTASTSAGGGDAITSPNGTLNIGGTPTNTTVDAKTTLIGQKFFGTAAPASVAGNLPGDTFNDTTNHHVYTCNAPSGTAAPACTAVGAGNWTETDGVGPAVTASITQTLGSIGDGLCLSTSAITLAGASSTSPFSVPTATTAFPIGVEMAVKYSAPNAVVVEVCNLTGAPYTAPSTTYTVGLSGGGGMTADGVGILNVGGVASANTAVLETRANNQAGTDLYAASASGSGTTYTAAMNPTLTAYTTGMTIRWKPDVNGTGGATTFNADTLGAIPIKEADGVTNPTSTDIVAGRMYGIWYDGASFRLPPSGAATATTQITESCTVPTGATVTANAFVKADTSSGAATCQVIPVLTTDTTWYGVAQTTVSGPGTVTVTRQGLFQITLDSGTATIGNSVQLSSTTAGDGHDSGLTSNSVPITSSTAAIRSACTSACSGTLIWVELTPGERGRQIPLSQITGATLETLSFCSISASTPTASQTYYEGGNIQTGYIVSWADAARAINSTGHLTSFALTVLSGTPNGTVNYTVSMCDGPSGSSSPTNGCTATMTVTPSVRNTSWLLAGQTLAVTAGDLVAMKLVTPAGTQGGNMSWCYQAVISQ